MKNRYLEALDKIDNDLYYYNPDYCREELKLIKELVDKETPIFENTCNAIFDEELLYEAIDWKCQNLNKYCYKKYKVYLYNGYPCISIAHNKIRIHQLLGEYLFGRIRKGYVIHHIDGNRLNNNKDNLQYLSHSAHSKLHNIGKEYTPCVEAIKKARKTNYREEITKEVCEELRNKGLTINEIAKKLNCSANTINRKLGMQDYKTKHNVLDWSDE